MKLLFFSCLLFVSFFVQGESVTSSIHSFDLDPKGSDHFIKLNSGEVIFVDDKQVINELESKYRERLIEFFFDEEQKLSDWRVAPDGPEMELSSPITTSPDYVPSRISSKETLEAIFNGQRKDSRRRSECYHRAYVWAYEEHKRNDHFLTKHFLFFTSRYIREYRYRWWFHVAPSVLYENESGKEEFIIFDRTFMKGPATLKQWTDSFIASKRDCPVVYVYSHYHNNQLSQHCYLIPTPMYYLQPLDIENFEKKGVEKKNFVPWDLNLSYRKGFTGPRL